MTGSVDYLQLDIADPDPLSVLDQDIRRRGIFGTEHGQDTGVRSQHSIRIRFVDNCFCPGFFGHLAVAHYVVDMAMGIDDIFDG